MILFIIYCNWYGRARGMFFLRLIINYYLDRYLCTGTWIFIINTGVANGCKMFLHLLHVFFLVMFALAILIFIVTILTLARSNNFVCIILCLQRASLVGFFLSSFFILLFYLPFLIFLFLVSRTSLCFISVFYCLAIFWCDICV